MPQSLCELVEHFVRAGVAEGVVRHSAIFSSNKANLRDSFPKAPYPVLHRGCVDTCFLSRAIHGKSYFFMPDLGKLQER